MSMPAAPLDDVMTTRLMLDSLVAACSIDIIPETTGNIMSSYVALDTPAFISHVSGEVKYIKFRRADDEEAQRLDV